MIEAKKTMKSELKISTGILPLTWRLMCKVYRTRIANRTDEIDATEREKVYQVMRDAIATLK